MKSSLGTYTSGASATVTGMRWANPQRAPSSSGLLPPRTNIAGGRRTKREFGWSYPQARFANGWSGQRPRPNEGGHLDSIFLLRMKLAFRPNFDDAATDLVGSALAIDHRGQRDLAVNVVPRRPGAERLVLPS